MACQASSRGQKGHDLLVNHAYDVMMSLLLHTHTHAAPASEIMSNPLPSPLHSRPPALLTSIR